MSYLPDVTVLASAARTASVAATVLAVPPGCDTVQFIFNATASAATPSVTLSVQVYDPVAGWITVLTSAALTGTGTKILIVGPNVPNVTNLGQSAVLGREVAIITTAADSDSLTYSVTAKFV